jgi:hypothetical protein
VSLRYCELDTFAMLMIMEGLAGVSLAQPITPLLGYLTQMADAPVEGAGPAWADAKKLLSANLTCSAI